MALSAEDQQLVADMRQREFNIKKRKRAANAVAHEARRYRRVLAVLTALVLACVLTAVFFGITSIHHDWLVQKWRLKVVLAVFGVIVGSLLARAMLYTRLGRRLLAREELRLNHKYSGELRAGRRWTQFYYQGEDISPYVPQILYVLESERRFDSVQAALEFVKQHHRENALAQAHALRQFNAVAAQTNVVVLSSVNAQGRPWSRLMRFVTTDRPGLWYANAAPDTPEVHEFDEGQVALITLPTEGGATISSNHVRIRRAGKTFMDVASLYRAQVPGYLDGMTEEDQKFELVYELTLQSAEVDGWGTHDVVSLREPDTKIPQQRPGDRAPRVRPGGPDSAGER